MQDSDQQDNNLEEERRERDMRDRLLEVAEASIYELLFNGINHSILSLLFREYCLRAGEGDPKAAKAEMERVFQFWVSQLQPKINERMKIVNDNLKKGIDNDMISTEDFQDIYNRSMRKIKEIYFTKINNERDE